MPTPRSAGLAATIGSRIYVVGGAPDTAGRVLEGYEPDSDRWVPSTPMLTPRNHLAGGVIGGRLHVVGGRPPATLSVHEVFDPGNQNEVYDPGLDSWTTLAPMPTPRHGIGAVALDGRIYIPGGATRQGLGAVAAVEAYDTPSDRNCS
jgi:N-acetylneuraminic acid mutarotase